MRKATSCTPSIWLAAALLAALPQMAIAASEHSGPRDVGRASTVQPLAEGSAVTTLAATLPLKRDTGSDAAAASPISIAIALGVLIACAAASVVLRRSIVGGSTRKALTAPTAWWRTLLRKSESRAIRVVAHTGLTPQARLYVVEWRGTEHLLSTAGTGVVVIDRRNVGQIDDGDASPQLGEKA
jgi:Flagellar biosynthesis protein, FliO